MAYEGVRMDDLIKHEVTDGIKYFTGPRTVRLKSQDPDDHWMDPLFHLYKLQQTRI